MDNYSHISASPEILGGKPVIKGTRISLDLILEWLANGASIKQIVETYPQLNAESVSEAIRYATQFMKNEIVIEVKKVA